MNLNSLQSERHLLRAQGAGAPPVARYLAPARARSATHRSARESFPLRSVLFRFGSVRFEQRPKQLRSQNGSVTQSAENSFLLGLTFRTHPSSERANNLLLRARLFQLRAGRRAQEPSGGRKGKGTRTTTKEAAALRKLQVVVEEEQRSRHVLLLSACAMDGPTGSRRCRPGNQQAGRQVKRRAELTELSAQVSRGRATPNLANRADFCLPTPAAASM